MNGVAVKDRRVQLELRLYLRSLMQREPPAAGMSRRELLKLIGLTAGSAAMYQAMTSLGYAAESGYKGPIKA